MTTSYKGVTVLVIAKDASDNTVFEGNVKFAMAPQIGDVVPIDGTDFTVVKRTSPVHEHTMGALTRYVANDPSVLVRSS